MSITSDILRGHTETIILSLLLKQDSYGYKINKEILARTDRRYELKEATLYSAFKRLEQAGCIRTYWGDETTGARRRYYSITEKGRETYASNRRDWEEAKELIDRLLDRGVSIIGIDCAGIRRGAEHTPKDQYCADRNTFVVENLCGLSRLLEGEMAAEATIYTFPVRFKGMTGLPCRVVGER